ncbi:MAG: PAS domain S-box protein [Syntrophobacteraceae bacterium]
MKNSKSGDDTLRRNAEMRLRSQMDVPEEISAEDAKGLIHELRVHQIELEMQNDELRRSQIQLEESRMRYADLYDFAPIGYVTFDQEGLIVEANLTAAKQLGKERSRILKRPLLLNVFGKDRDAFHLHLAKVFKTGERQTCEVRLAPEIGETFYARLDSIFIEDASGKCFARTSITDITDRKQAELEVQAKLAIEQEFHLFVSEVSDYAIFMLDPAGCVVSWNAGAEHTKGYKANEIISRNHTCFYTPEDVARDWPRRLLQRAILEKRVEDEGWRVRKDGSRFWANVVIAAVFDNGRLRGFSKVTRDITEQARLVADLQQSESKYRELVQNANSVIIRWKRDGTLTFFNEYAQKFFGYSAEEVIGKSVNILMPEQGSAGGDLTELLQDIVNHPERYVNNINENVLRDGSRVWMAWTNQPIFNDDGQVLEILAVASDITERKQAEEALRESKTKLEAALSSMTDAVFISDAEGGLVNFNDGFVTYHRFRNRDECSRSIADCPIYLDAYMADGHSATPEMWAIPRALRGETVNNTRYTLRRKDTGETWTGSYSFSPIRDKDGVIIGSVVVARDITEQQRMQEDLRKSRDELELRVQERTAELEQSNQALQDFASIASHDMREPLRKVISFGNMLRQKSGDSLGQSGNDYLNRMLHATERMQSLLAGLLDYSRVATAGGSLKEVDLSDLIGEVLADLEVRIVKTGGEVHVGTLPVISADPTQMRQLFQNLIGNALKFHKPGEKPTVHVSSVPNNDSGCQIVVEDSGIGFEEQHLDRIFAPFQRLHGRSSQYEGTGMGLAICKKIVERHGGQITARSAPGQGAAFTVTLPAKQQTKT